MMNVLPQPVGRVNNVNLLSNAATIEAIDRDHACRALLPFPPFPKTGQLFY